MKVAVIGGGSTYTPELVEGFGLRRDVLPVEELVLHDIDQSRLDVVGGLAERILGKLEFPVRLTLTTDRESAVEGADFVLVQLRVGGLRARLQDETIRPSSAASGRRRPGRAASRRRYARCRWCWRSPRTWRGWERRAPGCWTSPTLPDWSRRG